MWSPSLAAGFQTPEACGKSFNWTLSFHLVRGIILLSTTTWTSIFSFTYIYLATCFKTQWYQLSHERWILTTILTCIHPYDPHCCPRAAGAIEKLGLSLTNTEKAVCININYEGCSSLTPGSPLAGLSWQQLLSRARLWQGPDTAALFSEVPGAWCKHLTRTHLEISIRGQPGHFLPDGLIPTSFSPSVHWTIIKISVSVCYEWVLTKCMQKLSGNKGINWRINERLNKTKPRV